MKKKILDKKIEKTFEAGSGSLYIPILGDIFPSLFGQPMKEIEVFLLKLSDNKWHKVSKETYFKFKLNDNINVDDIK